MLFVTIFSAKIFSAQFFRVFCFKMFMKCGLDFTNLSFKSSITNGEIEGLKYSRQHLSDCYLINSLEALSRTENGVKVLKNQITHDNNNPNLINCYLYSPKGVKEKYSIPVDNVVKKYEKLYNIQNDPIVRSVDVSVDNYESKYKSKPLICRLTRIFKNYDFENNLPSHFLKIFTGKEPTINIAESSINLDLRSHKNEVLDLFKRMDTDKNHSILIATGIKKLDNRRWHVYILEDVDYKNGIVSLKEKRSNETRIMDIDSVLKSFKYIVGYFDEDLK